jgi:Arc/MetJ family transcription regulator
MKITLHIDEALLARVMKDHNIPTKTAAIEFALREVDRKSRLKHLLANNLGLTKEEWMNAFDPDYDVLAARVAETPKAPYAGKRTGPRR